jgi:hypothetical protein
VANGEAEQASPECVIRCVAALERISKEGKIALDEGWRVISEYRRHARQEGQPGLGDAFLKWVLTNYANPSRCVLAAISPITGDQRRFAEFPKDDRLSDFDKDDQKFVAISKALKPHPPICQAVDLRWQDFADCLEEHGVTVEFLCAAR